MTCEQAIDLVIDSLMDRLNDAERAALDEHLAGCAGCRAEAGELRTLWRGMADVPVPPPSPTAAEQLRAGVTATRRRRWIRPLARLAAAVALLLIGGAGGYLLRGSRDGSAANDGGASTFLLLVRGSEPLAPVTGVALVREYQAWADSLAGQGRLVGGNKLTDEPGRWITRAPGGDPRMQSDVAGYFLVTADDYEEAVAIAAGSPHIRYGGTFEIRRIDPQ